MRGTCVVRLGLAALAGLPLLAVAVSAEPLTADRAVEIALQHSSQVVNARAGVLDARSGVYGAYSGVLPRVSADLSRSANVTRGRESNSFTLNPDLSVSVVRLRQDSDRYTTSPGLTGSWSVLNLSALSGLSSARSGLKAARLQQSAARNDVALATRQQFYEVVRAIHTSRVNTEALHLSRNDERRVRALFEVGSVSKSDVLTAEVRTAQSELDSLTAVNQVSVQRIVLAEQIGIPEQDLGDVDTSLTVTARSYDEAAVLADAERARPDVAAAEAAVKSANASINSARFLRLPYVTVSGTMAFNSKSTSSTQPPSAADGPTDIDRDMSGSVALNWDVFDGLATDGRIAAARARLTRARETRDALRRNLAAEVRRTLLAHREAMEGVNVAQRAVDAASERLKLTQQKYNVGSSTILELVDSQVQLQRAENQLVSARAAVRVAEAAVDRVRGTPQ